MKRNDLGHYHVEPLPPARRLAVDAFSAVDPSHPMIALLELDVTDAVAAIARMQAAGTRVSLFAFVAQAIAVTLHQHPRLNSIRRHQSSVVFDDVDVNVPIELETRDGRVPKQLVIRRANELSAPQIYAQLEVARHRGADAGAIAVDDRWSRWVMEALMRLPRPLRVWVLRRAIRSPFSSKRHVGTTLVTSVGKMASIPGFVIPFSGGPRATLFALGSVVEKPVARLGCVEVRSVLALTVVFDHDVIDGGPAARFAKDLQERVETGAGLDIGINNAMKANDDKVAIALTVA